MSEPYIRLNDFNVDKCCLICRRSLKSNESKQNLTDRVWTSFQQLSQLWANLNLPTDHDKFFATKVFELIQHVENPFGKVHKTCRNYFFKPSSLEYWKRVNSSTPSTNDSTEVPESTVNRDSPARKVSLRKDDKTLQKHSCFICQVIRPCDSNGSQEGGLVRCGFDRSKDKLISAASAILQNESHRCYEAAQRFQRMLSGSSTDVFSVDIYYHKSCYLLFTRHSQLCQTLESDDIFLKSLSDEAESSFFSMIRLKIVREQQAYLLHEIEKDLQHYYDEFSVPTANRSIVSRRSLKRALEEKFYDDLSFFPTARYTIVHNSTINPCIYVVASLQGFGLRDDDIIKSFANFIKRKISSREDRTFSEDSLLQDDLGAHAPLPELYNTIHRTMYQYTKVNAMGYAETDSRNQALKIWSLALSWESLITRNKNAFQASMGLSIHRLTGKKQPILQLDRLGLSVPYNQVLAINKSWAQNQPPAHFRFQNIKSLHSTIDNMDMNHDTKDGSLSTHDTNRTLFCTVLVDEDEKAFLRSPEELCKIPPERPLTIPSYYLETRSDPCSLQNFDYECKSDNVVKSFKVDVLWALIDTVPSAEPHKEKLVGSWTAFKKKTTNVNQNKSIIQFQPMIPSPPNFSVCKAHLDHLNKVAFDLGLDFSVLHADEDVLSKIWQLKWNHPTLYAEIYPLMGGFHELRVLQHVLYKRYSCFGFTTWFVEAGVVQAGSVDQAWRGKHYYRNMRLHKLGFCAIIRFLFKNIKSPDPEFNEILKSFKGDISPDNISSAISSNVFEMYVSKVLTLSGTLGEMILSYLNDVSLLLSLVAAGRTSNFDLHLEAERKLLPLLFGFNNQNYARYLTVQYVFYSLEKKNDSNVYKELSNRGFGASYSGTSFSNVHGDLVTEYLNKEVKSGHGPLRSGFSTDEQHRDNWIKTAHLHATLQTNLRDLVHIKTTSTHKELTDSEKSRFNADVDKLVNKLDEYYPSGIQGEARSFGTGVEVDPKIVQGVLKDAVQIGEISFHKFVQERLFTPTVEGAKRKSIFDPIKRSSVLTGLEKKRNKPLSKVIDQQEDCQAFGMAVANSLSITEALSYPLTKYPLSISKADGTMRSGCKASLRNFIISIDRVNSVLPETPDLPGMRVLFDGMALYRIFKPRETYREWFLTILESIQKTYPRASQFEIISDHYVSDSVKHSNVQAVGTRVCLESVYQTMLKGKAWSNFFDNWENKNELVHLACTFFCSIEGRAALDGRPLVINDKSQIFLSSVDNVRVLTSSNHLEADCKIIYRVCAEDTPSITVAKDTDIFCLLNYATTVVNREVQWFMQIDKNSTVDIRHTAKMLGSRICNVLPQFHAITGCDTTSFKYKRGKVDPFKRLLKDPIVLSNLIKDFGNEPVLSHSVLEDAATFVKVCLYNGGFEESYLSLRVRLYKGLQVKSSSKLPPDVHSLKQDLIRCLFQVLPWRQCTQAKVSVGDASSYGWKINDMKYEPIWYLSERLPPPSNNDLPSASQEESEEVIEDEFEPPMKRHATEIEEEVIDQMYEDSDEWQSDWDSDATEPDDDSDWEF